MTTGGNVLRIAETPLQKSGVPMSKEKQPEYRLLYEAGVDVLVGLGMSREQAARGVQEFLVAYRETKIGDDDRWKRVENS